ncbi:MAG TPA: hypothetical protein VJP08_05765 [Actinomycetota bacterium]|nr:hypothetical protein [Actinomycetota bacterium]
MATLHVGNNPADEEVDRVTEPHTHQHQPAEPESGGGLTGYAIAKYGFILLIVIVVLWFVANYFLGE